MSNRIKHVKPTTPEEQSQAILRAIAMKRESFFQLILANLLQNEEVACTKLHIKENGASEEHPFDINEVVDMALKGADHCIELLYPVKPEE